MTLEQARRVQEALSEDPRTENLTIEVVDENGIVTLTGTVPDQEARDAAEEITNQQDGVVQVINDLEVDSSEGDFAVVAKVTTK